MTALDRKIKKERRRQYKMYKKAFKARDVASRHIDHTLTVSTVMAFYKNRRLYWRYHLLNESVSNLSIEIYESRDAIKFGDKPPRPPSGTKVSVKKLPPPPPLPPEPHYR